MAWKGVQGGRGVGGKVNLAPRYGFYDARHKVGGFRAFCVTFDAFCVNFDAFCVTFDVIAIKLHYIIATVYYIMQ